jgi:hypothetical protein
LTSSVVFFEGSLEVKLPTIRTYESGGKRQRRGEVRRETVSRKKIQYEEDQGARKGRKVAEQCVVPMFCGSGKTKSRLAKAAGA